MLCVSLRNLQVRDAFKVIPLELAMSSFLVQFVSSGWSSLSVPRLVIFHWDPKSNGETKRVYLLVINKRVKVVVIYIIMLASTKSCCKPSQSPNTSNYSTTVPVDTSVLHLWLH